MRSFRSLSFHPDCLREPEQASCLAFEAQNIRLVVYCTDADEFEILAGDSARSRKPGCASVIAISQRSFIRHGFIPRFHCPAQHSECRIGS